MKFYDVTSWSYVNLDDPPIVTPPSLDSKIEHYSSTTAHRASLSCQCKATERSENATSSRVQQSQITTPTGSIPNAITDTSVFRTRSGGLASFS